MLWEAMNRENELGIHGVRLGQALLRGGHARNGVVHEEPEKTGWFPTPHRGRAFAQRKLILTIDGSVALVRKRTP